MGLLTRDERRDLIEMLLKLPISLDAQTRRLLVRSLPIAIQQNISYSAIPRIDIETFIDSAEADSAQQADGSWPIVLVIEDAIGLVAGSMLASRLQQLLDVLRTRAAESSGQPGTQTAARQGPLRLNNAEQEQLLNALLSAFNLEELNSLVYFKLGVDLDDISGKTNRRAAATDLIRWAISKGRLEDLIAAARAENPGNPDLRAFADQVGIKPT